MTSLSGSSWTPLIPKTGSTTSLQCATSSSAPEASIHRWWYSLVACSCSASLVQNSVAPVLRFFFLPCTAGRLLSFGSSLLVISPVLFALQQ